jgi:hypothetical protein
VVIHRVDTDQTGRERVLALADALDAADRLYWFSLPGAFTDLKATIDEEVLAQQTRRVRDASLFELVTQAWDLLTTRLVRALALSGRLVGAEVYNECGDLDGVVTLVENVPPESLDWYVAFGEGNYTDLDAFADMMTWGPYIQLPGSKAWGAKALVEYARARA